MQHNPGCLEAASQFQKTCDGSQHIYVLKISCSSWTGNIYTHTSKHIYPRTVQLHVCQMKKQRKCANMQHNPGCLEAASQFQKTCDGSRHIYVLKNSCSSWGGHIYIYTHTSKDIYNRTVQNHLLYHIYVLKNSLQQLDRGYIYTQ